MSAIAGIINFDGRKVTVRDLELARNILQTHGRDRSEITVAGPVGFVNALMRMTPEDRFDCQPWRSPSGAMITADVRIDNRGDILTRIGLAAKDAIEWADSRVLLTAWEILGSEIWSMLRGPFAVAIWEPRNAILTLARDHLGLNVVMWHKSQRFFAFASMPRGLFALAEVPRQLNEEKFADFLVLNHSDLATTIYQSVYRVLPAHFIAISLDGSVKQRRYWSSAEIKPIRLSSDQAYADGLRDRLQSALLRHTRTSETWGCFLSGGLDSSSVAAVAAHMLNEKSERLSAFTQVPGEGFAGAAPMGRYADETPYVEAIARSLGNVDITYVHNDRCDDFAALERVFAALDGPVRNPMTLGWMLACLNLARAQGRRVMLSARHGNFAISWEGWSQAADHLRRGRLIKAYRQWQLFYRSSSLSRWSAFRQLLLEPLLPDRIANWANHRWQPQRDPPWQNYSPIKPGTASMLGVEARAAAVGHDFHHRLRLDERGAATTLADFDGDWAQAMKALTEVEVRDPTADVDVVSYCLAIPAEQFLVEGIDRSLIRRAMWGLLPEMVLTNRLRGVQSADWHEKLAGRRHVFAAEIAELAASPLAARFIDFDRLARAVSDWPTSGWHNPKIVREYRLVLPRGIAAARFLVWLERSSAP